MSLTQRDRQQLGSWWLGGCSVHLGDKLRAVSQILGSAFCKEGDSVGRGGSRKESAKPKETLTPELCERGPQSVALLSTSGWVVVVVIHSSCC